VVVGDEDYLAANSLLVPTDRGLDRDPRDIGLPRRRQLGCLRSARGIADVDLDPLVFEEPALLADLYREESDVRDRSTGLNCDFLELLRLSRHRQCQTYGHGGSH
jgi:hypothetical protein